MCAGAIMYATGIGHINKLGNMAKKMPFVCICFFAAAFSISGIPLFNGFISKAITVNAAYAAGQGMVNGVLDAAGEAVVTAEAKAIAQLHPDIINPEPSDIIGGGNGVSPMAYVKDSIRVIKEIYPDIMVEQAAGITNGQQVYDFIMAGSEAAGAASGIMNAADPIAMIDEMIAATRRAADDLKKMEG